MTAVHWHEGPLVGFDVETTGVDPERDRIVTAAVTLDGGPLPAQSVTWLLNPGIEIPKAATDVHGITTARAQAEGQAPRAALRVIAATLAHQIRMGAPLVVMNAAFDLTMLDRELRRYDLVPLTGRLPGCRLSPVIDPYVLDQKADRYRRGSRRLEDLAAHYGVDLDDAHDAAADARAAVGVARALAARYAWLRIHPRQLHIRQIRWAADRARDRAAYFARTPGKEHLAAGVHTDWPMTPYQPTKETR